MRFSLPWLCAALLTGVTSTHAESPDDGVRYRSDRAAHWMRPDRLWIRPLGDGAERLLLHAGSGGIRVVDDTLEHPEVEAFELVRAENPGPRPAGLDSGFQAFRPQPSLHPKALKLLLKGQLAVIQQDAARQHIVVSEVQAGDLVDALYAAGDDDADEATGLGATITAEGVRFRLWAPTARRVEVMLYDAEKRPLEPPRLTLEFDDRTGIWSGFGPANLDRAFYRYRLSVYHPATAAIETVTVTDPYSLSLATNSTHSQVVDLGAADTRPAGWDDQAVRALARAEDAILYELHIRDFSAHDERLAREDRGRYAAFSAADSNGVRHLRALAEAGVTHVHLLPAFDLSTIDEAPGVAIGLDDALSKVCDRVPDAPVCRTEVERSRTLRDLLAGYDPRSGDAQALIDAIRARDDYNWGYDPFHYTVPEGSYARQPDGVSRILAFRRMIQSLHALGFRVVMDVVYNHTFAAGLEPKSVLDRIVPGYYHRLDPVSGAVQTSTCCANTATERAMMGKLMMDSLVVWARDYRIDGFRFDLMGHQPRDLMLEARERVRAVDPDTYFYGEGWNFGEVKDDRLFVQARQGRLGGTEIGTFSDRLRDALIGGGFDADPIAMQRLQGLASGLGTRPNAITAARTDPDRYARLMDHWRLGLAGNLAEFPLPDAEGRVRRGAEIDYNGAPAGYAGDPADTINYVSKHDNQTLWDLAQYRLPHETSTEDRVRGQVLALASVLLAQGIPFIHMGSELLRSKSFLRDSFDYGDWFNAVDLAGRGNNYDIGLPPADKDGRRWPLIRELLERNEGRDQVSGAHIRMARDVFLDLVRIRAGSPLFRMATARDIIDRVSFHNTGPDALPGVVALRIADDDEPDLDPALEAIVVVFNAGETTVTVPMNSEGFELHPVQAEGADVRLRELARATPDGFVVPGLSAAVFVQ